MQVELRRQEKEKLKKKPEIELEEKLTDVLDIIMNPKKLGEMNARNSNIG